MKKLLEYMPIAGLIYLIFFAKETREDRLEKYALVSLHCVVYVYVMGMIAFVVKT